jgi:hypothetical protein
MGTRNDSAGDGLDMSEVQAITIVRWDVFRGGPAGWGQRVYDFGSSSKRLLLWSGQAALFG